MPLTCSMCLAVMLTLNAMISHFRRAHQQDDNFHTVCRVPGCLRSYTSFEGYKTHLRRWHKDEMNTVINEVQQPIQPPPLPPPQDDLEIPCNPPVDLAPPEQPPIPCPDRYDAFTEEAATRLNASYLLNLKETHKLTQRTVDDIVVGTTRVVQNSMELLKRKLSARLDTAGVDFAAVPGLQELFDGLHNEDNVVTIPFLGMETKALQDKAFKELFGLVVSNRVYFFAWKL